MILIDTSAWIQFLRIDTSAWIQFLRDTGSPTCEAVERFLARATLLESTTGDYETAAALFRSCRRQGETVRKLIDCLIATIAIREDLALLHQDADFDVIARHTGLRIHHTDP